MKSTLNFLPFFLLMATALAFALEPDKTPSPLDAPDESPAFTERFRQPWNRFLLDGQTDLGVGSIFYGEQRFSAAERFSLMPEFPIGPDFPGDDSARASAGITWGNEPGDPATASEHGFVRARPTATSRVAFEGDQSDMLSYRTFPRRAAILGTRDPTFMSFLGDSNLPLTGMVRGAGQLEQRGGTLEVGYADGNVWAPSLLTGTQYPLRAQGAELQAGVEDDLRMRFRYYQYRGASDLPDLAPRATLSEVGLALKGGGDPWIWKLEWAYRKRVVEKTSLWGPMDRGSYPWAFHGGREWKGDDSVWRARVQAGLEYDEGTLLSRGQVEAQLPWKKQALSAGARVYHRHPFDDSAFITERLPGDSAATAFYRTPANGRGAALWLGYAWNDSLWKAGVTGTGSMEWETPRFEGTDVSPVGAADIFWNTRRGAYVGSDYVLARAQATVYAEAQAGKRIRLRGSAGWQSLYGQESNLVEFTPSPYFGEAAMRANLPGGLRAEARFQGMGEKEYRGYGVALRVPPHVENHLGIEQPLFGEYLRARVALFHAFGDPVLEHPLGTPIRFRLTVGVTGKIR